MNLFDTLLERYRRHRAIHKYDRKFSFWLIDCSVFLVKLSLLGFALLTLVHYVPQAPTFVSQQIAAFRGDAEAPTAPVVEAPAELAEVVIAERQPPAEAIIPASLPAAPVAKPLTLVTIDTQRANLRERPTTRSNVLGQLPRGSKLTLFDITGNWAQVATNDELGLNGYVHLSLLKESESQLNQQLVSP